MIVTAIRVQSRLIALLPDSLKTKGNDQELLESNHISRHQNQKEKKYIQKMTTFHEYIHGKPNEHLLLRHVVIQLPQLNNLSKYVVFGESSPLIHFRIFVPPGD